MSCGGNHAGGAPDGEIASWLRETITLRLALARAATQAPWEAEGDDPTDDEVWIDLDDDSGIRLVICRGSESHENMLHIAANGPQAVIARCEADLALLDEHRLVIADDSFPEQGQTWGSRGEYRVVCDRPTAEDIEKAAGMHHVLRCLTCQRRPPCRTVRLLASGYRHADGYKPEWVPEA